MYLVTPACPLWRATEADLERLQLGEPYWAFAWPGGQALARFLLDQPHRVRHRRVLAVGAGGGVEALAAAYAGASEVWAVDVDPRATTACRLNAELNRFSERVRAETVDLVGRLDLEAEVVLAADVTYEEALSRRMAPWLRALARRGHEVYSAEPQRGFLDPAGTCAEAIYDAPADVDAGGRHLVATSILRWR